MYNRTGKNIKEYDCKPTAPVLLCHVSLAFVIVPNILQQKFVILWNPDSNKDSLLKKNSKSRMIRLCRIFVKVYLVLFWHLYVYVWLPAKK